MHKATAPPYQALKEFCSFIKPVKYKVTITCNNVAIIKSYNDEMAEVVKGVIKNGKLYTNDPLEKTFHFGGKLYLFSTTSLRINNLEGGDYVGYDLCR